MKPIFTIILLFVLAGAMAQRIQYGQPEKEYKSYASYDIIGHIGHHNLIFLKSIGHAEIAVHDEAMQKLHQVPEIKKTLCFVRLKY